jgi:hypothetical protein
MFQFLYPVARLDHSPHVSRSRRPANGVPSTGGSRKVGIPRRSAADLLTDARHTSGGEAKGARRAVVTAPTADDQVLVAEICALVAAAPARLPVGLRLLIEGCATGMRLVDLGQRLRQFPDAIRKAKQRAFAKVRSVAVALAHEWAKK